MTIANTEMAAGWDGPEGDYWAEHDDRFNGTIRPHAERLYDAAAIAASDAVLDIGCGCGASTREAARRATSGRALGADLSARMLARGRELAAAEGLDNVEFVQADAQVHPFGPASYDVAISRFGVMFFKDPVAAFRNIGTALKPHGRLALLVWRELDRNEWMHTIMSALAAGRALPSPPPEAPSPFSFADPVRARSRLGQAGFTDVDFLDVNLPVCLGTDADDAFGFIRPMGVATSMLAELDEDARNAALSELHTKLAEHATPEGVLFQSSAWLITARWSPAS